MRTLAAKDYGDTNFITGMRAFAALAVVLIHAGGAGLRDLGQIGNSIADFGRTGVYAFFVISGYSVASSFEASGGYLDYLNKRLWRIAPLYYFWIALAVLFSATPTSWAEKFGVRPDAYNLLSHFLFLGFTDYRVTNSILGVEWSISIEVFFYLLVPLLVAWSRKWTLLAAGVLVSLLVSRWGLEHPHMLPVPAADAGLAMHWSPIPYVFSYCLGIAAFRLRAWHRMAGGTGDLVLLATGLAIAAACALPGRVERLFGHEVVFVSLLTFVLIVAGSGRSRLTKAVLANRLVLFLGTISYGIYLSHVLVLSWIAALGWPSLQQPTVKFLAAALGASALSAITYFVVEKPGFAAGKWVAGRLNKRRVSVALG